MSTVVDMPGGLLDQMAEDDCQLTEPEEESWLREGSVHFCEGPLQRKRHRAQAKKKKWKQKWFKVEPARRYNNTYQLTESQGESRSRMAKLILTLPGRTPSLRTEPVSTDPAVSDFTAFNVYNNQGDNLLSKFRANDIVQQRSFMAALGSRGPGLFSQCPSAKILINTPTMRLQELISRQKAYNSMSQNFQSPNISRNIPKSFEEALQNFPKEYYFPDGELPPKALPGVTLPEYDPSRITPSPVCQRKVEFHPPHGPPVDYHSVLGCGAAADLEPGQIAVWNHKNELYYFLDGNNKTVHGCELRPRASHRANLRKCQISIQKGQSEKNLSLPPCDPAIVHATAERALRKPHGCVLKASGKSGRNGMSAVEAASGRSGSDGVSREAISSLHAVAGRDGEDGEPGDNGRHAEHGEDGGMGKNVIVELYGNTKELGIDGTCQSVARLRGEDYEEVLLVDCSGGDGGDGGNGGSGGSGGGGGNGGMGQNGGDGGHGAVGGRGGKGGNGGNAGCGGRGGNCVVRASDPQLLMLVEVNCDSGRAGRPGRGGSGGSGGKMGFGGAGSSGGPSSPTSEAGSDSFSGLQGKPGRTGMNGDDGMDGEVGFTHRAGSLLWEITSQDGDVIHSSTTRYDAEVLSMNTSSGSQGGVFEPHQRIEVTDIVVVNSGGLPLPAGAKVSIPSTETVRFEPIIYTLPQLDPAEQFVVPAVFRGQIVDEPSPNGPGPLAFTCQFAPRIELLGRPFEKSHLEKSLTVQYPVKLAYALAKKMICPGEVTTLEIGIENLSSVPYGMCSNSKGSVLIKVLLDPCLRPLGLANSHTDSNKTSSSGRGFVAKYDQNTIFILIEDLAPGRTLSIPTMVQVVEGARLGDVCRWQTEVHLRGKLIEYSSSQMRLAPRYSTAGDSSLQLADVLLIKTDRVQEIEMQFWQRIFELLEVSFDYWNASNGSQQPSDSFLPPFKNDYSGKFIIYPHATLKSLSAKDIVSHFEADSDSSMLLILDSPTPESLEHYIQQSEGNKKILHVICAKEESVDISPELYSGCHLFSPGTIVPVESTLQKAQRHVLKKLEREMSLHASMIVGQSGAIRRQGITYSYGKLKIKRCPLSRTANFQCIDGAATYSIEMGADDPHLTTESREIPLASNFGQIFLATLAGLPLHLKLNLLRKSPNQPSSPSVQFHLPNGTTLTRTDLAAVCLARDIVDEVFCGSSDLQRMEKLIQFMKDSHSYSAMDATIFSRLLSLIRREAAQRQVKLSKKLTTVSQALKHLINICDSAAQTLSPSPVLPSLPHLSQLQNTLTTLRPHQLTSDELFDLSH